MPGLGSKKGPRDVGRRPSKVDAADLLVLDAGRDKCDAKCKAGTEYSKVAMGR
jgi:hypothetical protein